MFKSPFLIGGLALTYGFLRSYLQRAPRVNDTEFIRYIRRQQIRRLFGSFDRTKIPGISE